MIMLGWLWKLAAGRPARESICLNRQLPQGAWFSFLCQKTIVHMTNRYQPLSDRQMKVLEWIASGCPSGIWDDYSYKHTTYALADRGLVSVDRRRRHWSTDVTDAGRYYLQHRQYRPEPEPRGSGLSPVKRQKPTNVPGLSGIDLIAMVQAVGGVLVIPDPAQGLRSSYRRAISKAIVEGAVPENSLLRHTGRDRGDLVVSLISRADAGQRYVKPQRIPLPAVLDETVHDTVRILQHERPELIDVSDDLRARALLVLQGIADECDRRSYEFTLRPNGTPTFRICLHGIAFDFALFEEYERRPIVDQDALQAAKYPWQRVRSTVEKVRSGRLIIQTGSRYSHVSWADRKRWNLGDRLPDLFVYIERSTIAQLEQRDREERERARIRQAWEEARERAAQLFVTDANRRRLNDQLAACHRAEDIRAFAEKIDCQSERTDDPELALRTRHWADWMRSEADRTDPLCRATDLTYYNPEEIKDSDLEPFMPRGASVWRPPPL